MKRRKGENEKERKKLVALRPAKFVSKSSFFEKKKKVNSRSRKEIRQK